MAKYEVDCQGYKKSISKIYALLKKHEEVWKIAENANVKLKEISSALKKKYLDLQEMLKGTLKEIIGI